jgi:hypothetical protein
MLPWLGSSLPLLAVAAPSAAAHAPGLWPSNSWPKQSAVLLLLATLDALFADDLHGLALARRCLAH